MGGFDPSDLLFATHDPSLRAGNSYLWRRSILFRSAGVGAWVKQGLVAFTRPGGVFPCFEISSLFPFLQ